MADIFQQSDAKMLLRDKYILFLGDSNVRALYKDLVWLLNSNSLIENHVLKRKLEYSFLGDTLLQRSALNKGRDYVEVREFQDFNIRVGFQFITRCFNSSVENLILSFKRGVAPDVIYYSSCVWDLSRWGPNGVGTYKDNIIKVMKLLKSCLPLGTLVIWGTTVPISSKIRSGFLIKQIEFLRHLLRFEVMEANTFARQAVVNYGFDVLDMHYYVRMQVHRRATDGIHYLNLPVRYMMNLLLTHIALSWEVALPGNIHNSLLDKKIRMPTNEALKTLDQNIPSVLSQLNSVAGQIANADNQLQQKKRRDRKKRGGVKQIESRMSYNSGRPKRQYMTRNYRQNPY